MQIDNKKTNSVCLVDTRYVDKNKHVYIDFTPICVWKSVL